MQDIEFISLVFDVAISAEDALQGYFLINHDPQGFEELPNGTFLVHLLKSEWTSEAETALHDFLETLGVGEATLLETLTYQNKDWNEQWEASIVPLKVSDELVITPSWRLFEATTMNAKHLIVIDPKMSFGTGHHETTRLCLQMIEHIDCTDRTILDLGSGTGILAMYAMMRGAAHAVAIDTDEWAFENAKENCERNQFGPDAIELRHGELAVVCTVDEIFEVVIANIHRNVLLAIGDQIAAHQTRGATLILSGILEYDADEIVQAYSKHGYQLEERSQENEWVCLRFTLNP